jgi:hypothetical protein
METPANVIVSRCPADESFGHQELPEYPAPTKRMTMTATLSPTMSMFVPVLIALAAMTRRRNVKLGNAGLILGGIGAISLPGALVTDFCDLAIRQSLPNDAVAARVSDKAGSYGLPRARIRRRLPRTGLPRPRLGRQRSPERSRARCEGLSR